MNRVASFNLSIIAPLVVVALPNAHLEPAKPFQVAVKKLNKSGGVTAAGLLFIKDWMLDMRCILQCLQPPV